MGFPLESVRVDDSGILLRSADMRHRKQPVQRIRGGSTGSGSVLTEKGKLLLETYDRFSEHLTKEANSLYKNLFAAFSE